MSAMYFLFIYPLFKKIKKKSGFPFLICSPTLIGTSSHRNEIREGNKFKKINIKSNSSKYNSENSIFIGEVMEKKHIFCNNSKIYYQ